MVLRVRKDYRLAAASSFAIGSTAAIAGGLLFGFGFHFLVELVEHTLKETGLLFSGLSFATGFFFFVYSAHDVLSLKLLF